MTLRTLAGVALLAVVLSASAAEAQFTIVSVTSEPADNASDTSEPQVFQSMPSANAGDLLLWLAFANSGGLTFTRSDDCGQTWSDLAGQTASNPPSDGWWAIFDGTFDTNCAADPSGTGANTTMVLWVVRPTSSSHTVAVDVTLAWESEGAGTTYTQTGQTRTGSSCVSLASFASMSASTWGSISGTGWTQITSPTAQFRNTANSDVSVALAHNIGTGASNNVSLTQSVSSAGNTSMISFCETAPTLPTYRGLTGVGR